MLQDAATLQDAVLQDTATIQDTASLQDAAHAVQKQELLLTIVFRILWMNLPNDWFSQFAEWLIFARNIIVNYQADIDKRINIFA